MYTRTGLAVLAVVLAAAALTASPAALAEERTCRGATGAATVVDLLVPQGATCTLKGPTSRPTREVVL